MEVTGDNSRCGKQLTKAPLLPALATTLSLPLSYLTQSQSLSAPSCHPTCLCCTCLLDAGGLQLSLLLVHSPNRINGIAVDKLGAQHQHLLAV